MAFEVLRNRVVLYGGRTTTGMMDSTPLGDTWEFDGSAWQEVFPPNGPGVRENHAMVYDTHLHRVIFFEGHDDVYKRADTWVYDGSDWRKLDTHPAFSPPPSAGHSLAYDAHRRRVVLIGGDVGCVPGP